MSDNRTHSGYPGGRKKIYNYYGRSYDRTKQANRQERPGGSRKRGSLSEHHKSSVILLFVIDIVIAAIALYVFALFYFILPRDESRNAQVLPNQIGMASESPSSPSQTDKNTSSKSASASSASADNTTWGEKFANKFTPDGSVEKTANSYKNGNMSVNVNKVQKGGVTYYIADIYLSDIKYFRTAFANGKFGTGMHESTDTIAKENNAVIAINGDYCGTNAGPVVRNGTLYRDETYTSDVLVLNNDGSMQTYSPEDFDMSKIKSEGAYQVWTFGPMLLKDGKVMDTFNSSVNPANPRTAVGYYEPGHYCFIVVDGRQLGYSEGYSTKALSQLFYDLGCKEAYNLDGGQSSEMAFEGKLVNKPYDGGRGTSDILYIAAE